MQRSEKFCRVDPCLCGTRMLPRHTGPASWIQSIQTDQCWKAVAIESHNHMDLVCVDEFVIMLRVVDRGCGGSRYRCNLALMICHVVDGRGAHFSRTVR